MRNVILGNGVSAYIIAACLDYFNEDFVIHSTQHTPYTPPILLLKYDDSTLDMYKKIFEITDDMLVHIKVGYLHKGKIHSAMTSEMKHDYLSKQLRTNGNTSISDGLSSYNAIRLDKVVEKLTKKYAYVDEINLNDTTIYDTCHQIGDGKSHELYLVNKCDLDLAGYDYVYDCDAESDVKRYSKNGTEYISKPNDEYVVISNYYDSPKIYMEYDCVNNVNHIYIGRYATKTQIKQEDIIKFIFNQHGGPENEI